MRRNSRPYLMRGGPLVTEERATSVDPPDKRVPEVRPQSLSVEQIRIISREVATDPRLRAVDRCFERWAVTPGDINWPGLAQPVLMHCSPQSRPSPLDDAESKIVSTAVRLSPAWAQRFIALWYRSDLSLAQIATALSMKHRQDVHGERHLVLGYFLGRLSEASSQLHLKA